jgi:hypothetical protein
MERLKPYLGIFIMVALMGGATAYAVTRSRSPVAKVTTPGGKNIEVTRQRR